jgi:epoxyqueuosine reductase QueG
MLREDIAMYTRISSRKIDDILSTFNKYGIVKANTCEKAHTYASLCDKDIQVCPIHCSSYDAFSDQQQHLCRTLESTPDLYLDELCQDLELHNGKSVSISTIWRTLRKAGYTMKKVCHDRLLCFEGDSVMLVL